MTKPLQIAVLERGFVYVGNCQIEGSTLIITNARCVRRWGTTAGLAQLANSGPTKDTKLDAACTVRAPVTALIHQIDCDPAAWAQTTAALVA